MNENNTNGQGQFSQTGVASQPIQVENVQYNVNVGKYNSKPGFIFGVASTSLAFFGFFFAGVLSGLAGAVLGYSDDFGKAIQIGVSVMIPAGIIFFIAFQRFEKLIAENPILLEDIKFKATLRRKFNLFLVVSAVMTMSFIYNLFEIGNGGEAVYEVVSLFFYAAGAILMALWLYRYQKMTTR